MTKKRIQYKKKVVSAYKNKKRGMTPFLATEK